VLDRKSLAKTRTSPARDGSYRFQTARTSSSNRKSASTTRPTANHPAPCWPRAERRARAPNRHRASSGVVYVLGKSRTSTRKAAWRRRPKRSGIRRRPDDRRHLSRSNAWRRRQLPEIVGRTFTAAAASRCPRRRAAVIGVPAAPARSRARKASSTYSPTIRRGVGAGGGAGMPRRHPEKPERSEGSQWGARLGSHPASSPWRTSILRFAQDQTAPISARAA